MSDIDEIIRAYKIVPNANIADLYESLVSREKKSSLGQYFTPPALADLLIDFSIRDPSDLVLEPACGCASVASRIPARVVCVDKDPEVVRLSQLVLPNAEVYASDMFDFKPELFGMFDAVVSNLPFVNKTKTDKSTTDSLAFWTNYSKKAAEDLNHMGFNFKKMSLQMDLYALCTIHVTRFLKEKGRAALIVSGGWVTAQYGLVFQEFLKGAYKIVAICESQKEHWFPYAQVNASVLLLERCSDKDERDAHIASFVKLKVPVNKISDLSSRIEARRKEAAENTMSVFIDDIAEYTFYPQYKLHG